MSDERRPADPRPNEPRDSGRRATVDANVIPLVRRARPAPPPQPPNDDDPGPRAA